MLFQILPNQTQRRKTQFVGQKSVQGGVETAVKSGPVRIGHCLARALDLSQRMFEGFLGPIMGGVRGSPPGLPGRQGGSDGKDRRNSVEQKKSAAGINWK